MLPVVLGLPLLGVGGCSSVALPLPARTGKIAGDTCAVSAVPFSAPELLLFISKAICMFLWDF